MFVRKPRNLLLPALVLAVFAADGPEAGAQCAPMVVSSGTSAGRIYIIKSVPAATKCHLTMFNNADCQPGGNFPPATSVTNMGGTVSATQVIGLTNPSCGWRCYCTAPTATVQVITNAANDGLPVELMDFAVEADEAVGGAGGDDRAGDETDKRRRRAHRP